MLSPEGEINFKTARQIDNGDISEEMCRLGGNLCLRLKGDSFEISRGQETVQVVTNDRQSFVLKEQQPQKENKLWEL